MMLVRNFRVWDSKGMELPAGWRHHWLLSAFYDWLAEKFKSPDLTDAASYAAASAR